MKNHHRPQMTEQELQARLQAIGHKYSNAHMAALTQARILRLAALVESLETKTTSQRNYQP